jgi:ribosomal protein S18 acetylase RimI-like enzyme
MDNLNVRFATLGDLAWCASVEHIPADWVRRKIDHAEALVAERDGQPVGYVRVEYLWSMIPYIGLIWVVEAYRRQGVGRALLVHLESYLRDSGYTVLMSSSQVNEPPPQAWHRHMGFEECGILAGINEGGIGEVFFRKTL